MRQSPAMPMLSTKDLCASVSSISYAPRMQRVILSCGIDANVARLCCSVRGPLFKNAARLCPWQDI